MKYVAYYRVSTNKQGVSGLGLEGQSCAVESFLANKGGELIKSFTEVKSGKRDDNRPELQRALRECRLTGATLLVAKLDRLARSARFLIELQESAIDFVCADMPEANRLTVQLMAALAEYERMLTSERTKAAYQAKKKRCEKTGESMKWGNPDIHKASPKDTSKAVEARVKNAKQSRSDAKGIILEIIEAEPYKLSSRQIAAKLREAGYKTPTGKPFNHVQVLRAMAA